MHGAPAELQTQQSVAKRKEEQREPPAPVRQLTAEAKARLNALLAAGMQFDAALREAAAWSDVAEPVAERVKSGTPADPNLDGLVARLIASHIATPGDLRGIPEAALVRFVARHPGGIPATYRTFLRRIGAGSGRLFKCDHYETAIDALDELARIMRRAARKAKLADAIPDDAIVVCGRLGEQFLYVRGGDDDSPVWYFHEDGTHRKAYASVVDWLADVASECERAIAIGYFEMHPDGTTP